MNSGRTTLDLSMKKILYRLSYAQIIKALSGLPTGNATTLLVHSSLSKCGYINGGGGTVVAALEEYISGGTLVMPTHTYCYPDKDGIAPIFEVVSTRSRVGAITEFFRQQVGVFRSIHPTHSIACRGRAREDLCRGHELCDTPCGTGTPYERLVDRDCSVVMFGTTMDSYTLFHTAEHETQVPYLYETTPCTLRYVDMAGTVRSLIMWKHDMQIARRFAAMDSWLEEHGLLFKSRLGRGELLIIPRAGDLHLRLVKELRRDPLFLVADTARKDVAGRFQLR